MADEEIIECRCGKIIKLQDKDNSAKEAIGKLNQAFDDLVDSSRHLENKCDVAHT